jgi:type IV secretory pathway VirB6-like protein
MRSSFLAIVSIIAMLTCILLPQAGFAQAAVPHGTCTTDPQFVIPSPAPGKGLISVIVVEIQKVLNAVSSALFTQIITDGGFIQTLQALATLYVLFYGIMFTFGMVQITLFDFSIRMIKIGLIGLLLSPTAWFWFNDYVVKFFNAGTDDWINQISAAVLNVPVLQNAPPFYVIDTALSKAVSAKMAVTLMAMFFTPPYGPMFGLLLAFGLGTFIRAVLTAAWVYLMSLILKALLFGIAPIFLSFLLFVRTRYLFDGWLNQIVNATLQPILLFTFLGFFVKLLEVAIDNVLVTPVCWTEWAESMRGTPFSVHYWRFTLCNVAGGAKCEPYGGAWSFDGPQSAKGPIFPIDILGILVLVMLADLCSRFNSIVILIASDLASASTNIASMQGAMGDWLRSANKGGRSPDGGAIRGVGAAGGGALPNQRIAPGVGNRIGGSGLAGGGGGGSKP